MLEALTLQSPENCVLAQLVHSSHIGECAPNQSKNGKALRSLGIGERGTHNNDPLALSSWIFSRSASDGNINHLTGKTETENLSTSSSPRPERGQAEACACPCSHGGFTVMMGKFDETLSRATLWLFPMKLITIDIL